MYCHCKARKIFRKCPVANKLQETIVILIMYYYYVFFAFNATDKLEKKVKRANINL